VLQKLPQSITTRGILTRRTSLDLRLSSAACHGPALADFEMSQLLPLLTATIQPIVCTFAEQDRVFTPEAM
jgi:hypothetical protein